MEKGKTATELKGIISNVTNREYSNYKKEKHVKDAKYGFYKYMILNFHLNKIIKSKYIQEQY